MHAVSLGPAPPLCIAKVFSSCATIGFTKRISCDAFVADGAGGAPPPFCRTCFAAAAPRTLPATTATQLLSNLHRTQFRDCRPRRIEITLIFFDSHAGITKRFRCGERRTGTRERVENGSFAQRQNRPNDLSHECLGLETGGAARKPVPVCALARKRSQGFVAPYSFHVGKEPSHIHCSNGGTHRKNHV